MEVTWQDLVDGAAGLVLDPAGIPSNPVVLIDLDAHPSPPVGVDVAPGAAVVGVTEKEPRPEALPHLTCWVAPADTDAVTATATRSPIAAVTLAQVLRAGPVEVRDALLLESVAYSALLAGSEFAAWLASRPQSPHQEAVDPIVVDRDQDVLTVTLNRPDRHNAYSAAMRDALRRALDVALADPTVQVVLRGNGTSFCSGGDLAEFGLAKDLARAHLVRVTAGAAVPLHRLRDRTRVQVHGACIGAGVELAAFAGRVEAHPDTFFSLPELVMGLIPGAGGTASLPRRIGRWRTAQLALTQERIGTRTALEWGLVDACTD